MLYITQVIQLTAASCGLLQPRSQGLFPPCSQAKEKALGTRLGLLINDLLYSTTSISGEKNVIKKKLSVDHVEQTTKVKDRRLRRSAREEPFHLTASSHVT